MHGTWVTPEALDLTATLSSSHRRGLDIVQHSLVHETVAGFSQGSRITQALFLYTFLLPPFSLCSSISLTSFHASSLLQIFVSSNLRYPWVSSNTMLNPKSFLAASAALTLVSVANAG